MLSNADEKKSKKVSAEIDFDVQQHKTLKFYRTCNFPLPITTLIWNFYSFLIELSQCIIIMITLDYMGDCLRKLILNWVNNFGNMIKISSHIFDSTDYYLIKALITRISSSEMGFFFEKFDFICELMNKHFLWNSRETFCLSFSRIL